MYVISNGHNYIMKRKGGRICATCDINLAYSLNPRDWRFVRSTSFPPGIRTGTMHRSLWMKLPLQARVRI
jgi:hypothetical protein